MLKLSGRSFIIHTISKMTQLKLSQRTWLGWQDLIVENSLNIYYWLITKKQKTMQSPRCSMRMTWLRMGR